MIETELYNVLIARNYKKAEELLNTGTYSKEFLEKLLEEFCDVSADYSSVELLLRFVTPNEGHLFSVIYINHPEMMKLIVPHIKDISYNTIMAYMRRCCEKNYHEIANILFSTWKYDVSHVEFTFLMRLACKEGYLDIVKVLLNHGVKLRDSDLAIACDYRRIEVACFLVEQGLNKNNLDERNLQWLESVSTNEKAIIQHSGEKPRETEWILLNPNKDSNDDSLDEGIRNLLSLFTMNLESQTQEDEKTPENFMQESKIIQNRKRPNEVMESQSQQKRQKTLKLENAPPVHSIQDLIELGKSVKYYKNIDTVMLWRITPYLEELNEMVGMESLKKTVFSQVIYYLQGMHKKNKGGDYLHTVIYGSPGTGKTTVAQIIGKIYKGLNVLSPNGEFRIAYRDDFVAGYLGQTSIKTKKLLNSCIGGVLFIDEVYAMGPRDSDRDSFAKEAIDTINAFLSEHKNDMCCIIAGYEDEVANCFFSMNKGLKRRFPWVHRISEYKPVELANMFLKMVKSAEWETSFDKKVLCRLFDENKELFVDAGGDIETFLTKCKMMHSERVFTLNREEKFILSEEDLKTALKFLKENNVIPKDEKHLTMFM